MTEPAPAGAPEPRLLAELTWPAIAELVSEGEELCLLPVGATEQHGRHLPASTDTDITVALCAEVSRRTGVPVLPPLSVGSSRAHTTAWPGTLSLPPRLLVEVVVELARWIRASGFKKLLLVNGHVGNVAALRVAVEEIRHAGELRAGLVSWYELSEEIDAAVRADAVDWHAHAAETSLMLFLRPDIVCREQIRDDPDRTGDLVFSYTVAETSREGVTGAPSLGTSEEGARLFAIASSALAERVERGRRERPPSLDA